MNVDLLICGNDKIKYTKDSIYLSNNVYFTFYDVVKFKNKIISTSGDDGSQIRTKNEIIAAINNGNDVIINLKYNEYIVAAILPNTIESKIKNAINNENYELVIKLMKENIN